MANITVKIVTPEKIYYEGECEMVTAPSVEGELGVLANHVPLLANLSAGHIKLFDGSKTQEVFVSGGILNFENDQAIILTEEVIDLKSLDKADLEKQISELTNKISEHLKAGNDEKLAKAQAELNNLTAIQEAA